uniref:Large ribosomal subunit protein uL6c n=1 Tax=Melanthalia intermedia TaxID=172989 RepID=A0A345UAW2_9FLOR|nr:ribosomal protein L6 [Melanthalia intermedia]AXI97598.1 ribosomal protein L6 [Melanthalia intermedia]
MSRIGKQPINLPKNIKVVIEVNKIKIEGPKGKLKYKLPNNIKIEHDEKNNKLRLSKVHEMKETKSLHGLSRTLINNMIIGVSSGFEKKLEIQGVGYRGYTEGRNLVLNVGYSHEITVMPPKNTSIYVENNVNITVQGINKELVGKIAAKIRSIRPPEPYKGKGIRYLNEKINIKVGKAGK